MWACLPALSNLCPPGECSLSTTFDRRGLRGIGQRTSAYGSARAGTECVQHVLAVHDRIGAQIVPTKSVLIAPPQERLL